MEFKLENIQTKELKKMLAKNLKKKIGSLVIDRSQTQVENAMLNEYFNIKSSNSPLQPQSVKLDKSKKVIEEVSTMSHDLKRAIIEDDTYYQIHKDQIQSMLTIFNKSFDQKTDKDKEKLVEQWQAQHSSMTENSNLTSGDFKELVSNLYYKKFEALEDAVTYGDPGDCFITIFKGVAVVKVPNNAQIQDWGVKMRDFEQLQKWRQEDFNPRVEDAKAQYEEGYQNELRAKQQRVHDQHDCEDHEESKEKFVFDYNIHMVLTNIDKNNLKDLKKYEETQWFIEVQILKTGMSFGELALLQDTNRQATVKCITNLYCAILDRKEYLKILRKVHVRDEHKKIDFLIQLPFLKHLRPNQLRGITKSFVDHFYGINQYLFTQNQESRYVYVIKQGDFDIFHKIKQKREKSNDPMDNRVQKEKFYYKDLKVATISKGQVIGFNDVMLKRPYSVSVRCTVSSGIAFAVQADEFVNKMQKDQQTWSVLCQMCKDKDKNIKEHVKQSNFNVKKFSVKMDPLDFAIMKKSPKSFNKQSFGFTGTETVETPRSYNQTSMQYRGSESNNYSPRSQNQLSPMFRGNEAEISQAQFNQNNLNLVFGGVNSDNNNSRMVQFPQISPRYRNDQSDLQQIDEFQDQKRYQHVHM